MGKIWFSGSGLVASDFGNNFQLWLGLGVRNRYGLHFWTKNDVPGSTEMLIQDRIVLGKIMTSWEINQTWVQIAVALLPHECCIIKTIQSPKFHRNNVKKWPYLPHITEIQVYAIMFSRKKILCYHFQILRFWPSLILAAAWILLYSLATMW